jgi:hypothetical protein
LNLFVELLFDLFLTFFQTFFELFFHQPVRFSPKPSILALRNHGT